MEKYANRFSIPNEVMILKLSAKALAIYTYLLYQPKSGTAVAYNYAVRKKKEIINVFK